MTAETTERTADEQNGAHGLSEAATGATRGVKLPPDAIVKLVQLDQAVAEATRDRDIFQAGLCAALGLDPSTVRSLDVLSGELIVDA